MCAFKVLALGDSLMWGQGLKHDTKFAVRAAKDLAKRLGQDKSYVMLLARSGAILDPLNEGAPRASERAAQRAIFADTYPEIFPGEELRENFIAGDESNAMRLNGEIPARYPTVREQIRIAVGAPNLVLLSGGANDVDFAQVLNPRSGLTPERMDRKIKLVMYESFKATLTNLRESFPNAIIAAVSYYSAFSSESNRDRLKQLAKHMSGLGGEIKIMEVLQYLAPVYLHIPFLFGSSYADDELDEIVDAMIERSEFAFTRALYWQSVAVAELANDGSLRGPGIILVHSGFNESQAVFGEGVSYIFEDYNPTKDPARDDRMFLYPRTKVAAKLSNLFQILGRISQFSSSGHSSDGTTLATFLSNKNALTQQLKAMNDVRGPLALVQAKDKVLTELAKVQTGPTGEKINLPPSITSLYSEVRTELMRIEHVRLASFLHPSEEGAKRYATRISETVWATLNPNLDEFVDSLAGKTKFDPPDKVLEAYGLDPAARPEELIQFSRIHSLAVKVETRNIITLKEQGKTQPSVNSVMLHTQSGREWQLKTPLTRVERDTTPPFAFTEDFAPDSETLFTFDPPGGLELHELAGLSLEVDGNGWQPGRFELIVNGQRLFEIDLDTLGPWINHGTRRILPYPLLLSGKVVTKRVHT